MGSYGRVRQEETMEATSTLELGARVEQRTPTVELFANNLHNPSHMEWSHDGRLLVSERGAGRVTEITDGGDMADAEPFATGLEGPTRLHPMADGRLLAVEFEAGRIKDISEGGDVSDVEPFVEGLNRPYSLVGVLKDGKERLYVSEDDGTRGWFREVTAGGHADDLPVVWDEFPTKKGHPGYSPVSDDWENDWVKKAGPTCNSWLTAHGEKLYSSVSIMGEIIDLTGAEHDKTYAELVEDGRRIMTGRDTLGGLKYNPHDDVIYGVEPGRGEVFVADPDDEEANHQFRPGIVRGLGKPSCLRFSEDNEAMFVCGLGHGTIWKVTDFR